MECGLRAPPDPLWIHSSLIRSEAPVAYRPGLGPTEAQMRKKGPCPIRQGLTAQAKGWAWPGTFVRSYLCLSFDYIVMGTSKNQT